MDVRRRGEQLPELGGSNGTTPDKDYTPASEVQEQRKQHG
jgi:hypothetical protein